MKEKEAKKELILGFVFMWTAFTMYYVLLKLLV